MGRGRTWTKDEKALLRLWMAENPNEYVTTCTVPKSLAGLFPDRRVKTVGKMLYYTRRKDAADSSKNLKNEKQNTPSPPKSLPRFTELFDLFINKILDEEVAKFVEAKVNAQKDEDQKELDALLDENAKLQRELVKCKELLRKLTKVREAIEDFKL